MYGFARPSASSTVPPCRQRQNSVPKEAHFKRTVNPHTSRPRRVGGTHKKGIIGFTRLTNGLMRVLWLYIGLMNGQTWPPFAVTVCTAINSFATKANYTKYSTLFPSTEHFPWVTKPAWSRESKLLATVKSTKHVESSAYCVMKIKQRVSECHNL